MIFKMSSSKKDPYDGIAYILRPDKACATDSCYLTKGGEGVSVTSDFARQFRETKRAWRKGERENEIQFFHAKVSPRREDGATPERLLACANEIVETMYGDFEAVIAVHNDTKTPHAHIILNSVSFVDGKHLHYSPNDIDKINDLAQHIGLKYGFSLTDKKPARDRKSAAEKGMEKRGLVSDRQRLKEIILKSARASKSEDEFMRNVRREGVEVPRHIKDFSFKMPGWQKATRGTSLGSDYSKASLEEIYLGNAWADYMATAPRGSKSVTKKEYIDRIRAGKDPIAEEVQEHYDEPTVISAKPLELPPDEYHTAEGRYIVVHQRYSDGNVIFEHKKDVVGNYTEAQFAVYIARTDRLMPWENARYTADEWEEAKDFVKGYRLWKAKQALRAKRAREQAQHPQPSPQPVKKKDDDGFYK
ncbi:MAG: relaxase/mobilization nuclease domain-containing protein [Bacteroidales bacterium]|nr:relaxase/mobilization nuclease domain-containing protein [Bacteroidales bacterium]